MRVSGKESPVTGEGTHYIWPGTYGPEPAPIPVFVKYLIPQGLLKNHAQVCDSDGFETHCFDIDAQFLRSM